MTFSFIKALKCFFCSQTYLIEDAKFPEDVFDIITRNKLYHGQLIWACEQCKNDSGRMLSHLHSNGQRIQTTALTYREIDIGPTYSLEISSEKRVKTAVASPCFTRVKVDGASDEDGLKVHRAVSSSSASSNSLSDISPGSSSPPDNNKGHRKHAHSILNAIKIPQDDKSRNKQIVTEVFNTILSNLRKNDDVNPVVNRYYYTGSAYNDLNIVSAREFDIDLVLKVPKCVKLNPMFFNLNPTFIKLKWSLDSDLPSPVLKFLKENSIETFIQPQKVLSWLQRHIDLIIQQKLELPKEVVELKKSASGPARTIIIVTNLGYDISVDLVPVFEFDYSILYGQAFYSKKIYNFVTEDVNKNKFFAVPKECTDEDHISSADSKLSWRLDFPNAESVILTGKECAKSVIKILKIFRDSRKWKDLASYYIKMVIILEIIDNNFPEYWKNEYVYQRLLDCFKKLKDYMSNGNLPHFLTGQNLLSKFNESQCADWSNHLRNMIKSWEANPDSIERVLNNTAG